MKKILFYLFLALLSSTMLVQSSHANAGSASQEAQSVVQASVDELIAIVSSPEYKNPDTKAQKRKEAEDSVMKAFDFEEFSTRTVGPRWRSFTAEEKTAFIAAFTNLLRNTYIDALDNYSGQTVEYLSALEGNNGTRVEIRVNIQSNGQKFPLAFRMLKKNNAWVVYDVLIENISLIKNYREQFKSILQTAAPMELSAKIQEKAEEIVQNPSN